MKMCLKMGERERVCMYVGEQVSGVSHKERWKNTSREALTLL